MVGFAYPGGSMTKPRGGKIVTLKQLRKKFANESSIRKPAVVLDHPSKQQQQQLIIRKNVANNDLSINKPVVVHALPVKQQQLITKNLDTSITKTVRPANGSRFDSCPEEDATLSPFVSFLEETLSSPKSVLKENNTKNKFIKTEHPGGGVTNELVKKRKTEYICLGDRIAASYKTKNVKPKSTILSKKLNDSIGEKRKPDLIENNQPAKMRKTEDCRLRVIPEEANKKKDTPHLLLASNTVPSCLTEAMKYAKRREERATGISLRYKLLNEERVAARALRDAMEREVVIVDNFQVMKDFWMLTGNNGDGVVMGPCRIYH